MMRWISSTAIGDLHIPLSQYILGKEYGMALGAVELLFVVVVRYLAGFGFGFSGLYLAGGLIKFLSGMAKGDQKSIHEPK